MLNKWHSYHSVYIMVISGASVSPSLLAPPSHISCPALPRRSEVVGVIAPPLQTHISEVYCPNGRCVLC